MTHKPFGEKQKSIAEQAREIAKIITKREIGYTHLDNYVLNDFEL